MSSHIPKIAKTDNEIQQCFDSQQHEAVNKIKLSTTLSCQQQHSVDKIELPTKLSCQQD